MIDRVRLRRVAPAALLLVSAVAAACTDTAGGDPADNRPPVTVLADESWSIPADLRSAFERQTDLRLDVRHIGQQPAELVDHLSRHRGERMADAVVGIDSSTAQQALAAGVLEPYTSPEANKGQQRFSVDKRQRLSAVDLLSVCVNIDTDWFAEHDVRPPKTLADLTEPAYANLLVVPSPAESAEGLAFLLGTVARFGDGWPGYWSKLKANGVRIEPSLRVAYQERFTGAAKAADRPIVVAPASAPGELADGAEAKTAALPETCHQEVRYAGVLADGKHPQRAARLLDFLLTQQFQEALPEGFGTYPVRKGVELPDGWDKAAPLPKNPTTLPARTADASRKQWVQQWISLMGSG